MSARWGDIEGDLLPQHMESVSTANAPSPTVNVAKEIETVAKLSEISKRVNERKTWSKFGAAALNSTDSANVTYRSHEDVFIENPNAAQVLVSQQSHDILFTSLKTGFIVTCRHCGMMGDHWTLKCPHKDTFTDGAPTLGKYVPPSLRGRAGLSSSDARNEESQDDRDSATLRVTNISPDTREDDLKDLFRAFGPVARVYLAKDRETFQSRGFAFVSFMYREDAERAMNKLQGYGYDHLILKIEWAKPSNKPAGESQDPGSMSTTFRSGYGKALPQNVAPSPRK